MKATQISAIMIIGVIIVSLIGFAQQSWSDADMRKIESLWLGKLPPLPPSPSNRVADNLRAARFGQLLFFDPSFSANSEVACASCHTPDEGFAEHQAVSTGITEVGLNAPTIIGAAHSPWQFWDGRADSLWAQALGPLENPAEMGGDRLSIARTMAKNYAKEYVAIFGQLPPVLEQANLPTQASPAGSGETLASWMRFSASERAAITNVFVNVGKALEAYERKLTQGQGRWSKFDLFVDRLRDPERGSSGALSSDEEEGLRLFIGKANCIACHATPMMTDYGFHDTGTRLKTTTPMGRVHGVAALVNSEFSCRSRFNDAPANACDMLNAVLASPLPGKLEFAVKTPGLRSITQTQPYGIDGRFETLSDVLRYKNKPSAGSELKPLGLSTTELQQLEAFLVAAATPIDADPSWLEAPVR